MAARQRKEKRIGLFWHEVFRTTYFRCAQKGELKRVLKQNPRNGVIESMIETIERNYAIKLIEIANEQIKKYD